MEPLKIADPYTDRCHISLCRDDLPGCLIYDRFAAEPGYESEDALLTAVRASIQKKSKEDFLACSCVAQELTDNLEARFETTTPIFMTHGLE